MLQVWRMKCLGESLHISDITEGYCLMIVQLIIALAFCHA